MIDEGERGLHAAGEGPIARVAHQRIEPDDRPRPRPNCPHRLGQDRGIAAIEAVAPVLNAICPRRHYLGAAGNGGRAKLAINLILDINRAGLAEGLVFAERVGLDPAAFLKVARESAAYSQIMDVKGNKMVTGDFSAHGRITQTLKDILLTLEQAARSGQHLPLGTVYADLIQGCVAHGEADWDNSAVIQEIRRRTQADVSKAKH